MAIKTMYSRNNIPIHIYVYVYIYIYILMLYSVFHMLGVII